MSKLHEAKKKNISGYIGLILCGALSILLIYSIFLIYDQVQINVILSILLFAIGIAIIGLNEVWKTSKRNHSNILFAIGAEICLLAIIIFMIDKYSEYSIIILIVIIPSIIWMVIIVIAILHDLKLDEKINKAPENRNRKEKII